MRCTDTLHTSLCYEKATLPNRMFSPRQAAPTQSKRAQVDFETSKAAAAARTELPGIASGAELEAHDLALC
jgi:hypothetical protein